MKRKNICLKYGCTKLRYLGGLCRNHAEEKTAKEQMVNEAVQVLHLGVIDKKLPLDLVIREELNRLCVWWRCACNSINYSIPHKILNDEAEAATHWCIALAQELIKAGRAARTGNPFDANLLNYTRQWVWECFNNLERGLMSNGIERKE